MSFKLKQYYLQNKTTFHIIIFLIFLGFISPFLNKIGVDNRMKLFNRGYYTEAIVTKFTQETRSSFYEYSFYYNDILVTDKSYKRGYNLIVGEKYFILFNPQKPSDNFLLHPFKVSDSLKGKNIVWKELPPFLNREKVLKFLKEY